MSATNETPGEATPGAEQQNASWGVVPGGTAASHSGRSPSWQALVDRARLRNVADVAPGGLKRTKHQLFGPCMRCGGTDRFWVDLVKQRWGCRGCKEGGDVIALAMFVEGCDFKAAVETLADERFTRVRTDTPPAPEPADDNRHTASMLWSKRRQPITGTAGERYLREVRKIRCPLPPTLGFLPASKDHPPAIIPAVPFAQGAAPGIIATPQNVDAIHLTRLKADGSGKAEVEAAKGYLASPGDRPIVVAPPNDLLGMALTEGIEDALSLHEATGLGVWAAGTAHGLPKVAARVPGWGEGVTIFGHDDPPARRHGVDAAPIL